MPGNELKGSIIKPPSFRAKLLSRSDVLYSRSVPRHWSKKKKTARKAPASSQGSFLLLYYPIFGFFCLVILFLYLSNFTNTVFVEFLTNKQF